MKGVREEGGARRESARTHLEVARLLKLLEVALALEGRSGGEEDVLDVAVDVLLPRREPRHLVVVDDVLPAVAGRSWRDGDALADVDRDLLGADARLFKRDEEDASQLTALPREDDAEERATAGRTLSMPVFGCSPRPRNRPGGSILKLPTFSLRPSRRHVLYLASASSRSALAAFFSAAVMLFLVAFCASR